jgi:hypothetical protein
MRLHTHTLLSALGSTGGLWSPLRGFVHNTERYDALLADADCLRRGDLDGRGNLSAQALITWIDCVLDTRLDQAGFMCAILNFASVTNRIEACLVFETTVVTVVKQGAHQALLRGCITGSSAAGRWRAVISSRP